MKGSIQGFEIVLKAVDPEDGIDIADMAVKAKALGMEAVIVREKDFVGIRITAKIKPGPKQKHRDTEPGGFANDVPPATESPLSNIGEVLKDKKELN